MARNRMANLTCQELLSKQPRTSSFFLRGVTWRGVPTRGCMGVWSNRTWSNQLWLLASNPISPRIQLQGFRSVEKMNLLLKLPFSYRLFTSFHVSAGTTFSWIRVSRSKLVSQNEKYNKLEIRFSSSLHLLPFLASLTASIW